MPMYYFHLRNTDLIKDVDGTDLPDEAAARAHATGVARELMSGSSGMLDQDWSRWSMAVHDESGNELFSFPFIETKGDGAPNN
ncbi:MAG: hypothetical protein P8Y71_28390 [Pseudolabrys sp.]